MPFTECVYYPSSDTKTKKKKKWKSQKMLLYRRIQCHPMQIHQSRSPLKKHAVHTYYTCIHTLMYSDKQVQQKKKCEWLKVCNKMQVFQSSWIFLVVLIQVIIFFPLVVELWILQKQTVRDDHVKSNVKSNTVINHILVVFFCVTLSNDVKTFWHFFIVLFSSQPIQSRSW